MAIPPFPRRARAPPYERRRTNDALPTTPIQPATARGIAAPTTAPPPPTLSIRPRASAESHRLRRPEARDDGRSAVQYSATPAPQGLYDPQFERDACGVAAVADIKGRRSHSIVADGVTALINLDHRGAAGADPAVGDGAGILIQVPDELFRAVAGFPLPTSAPTRGTARPTRSGWRSCPPTRDLRARAKEIVARIVAEEGLELLGWRPVPTDPVGAGVGADGAGRHARLRAAVPGRPGARRTARSRSASTWTGWSTRRASGSSTTTAAVARRRATASTSRRCPAAPSSTRAC